MKVYKKIYMKATKKLYTQKGGSHCKKVEKHWATVLLFTYIVFIETGSLKTGIPIWKLEFNNDLYGWHGTLTILFYTSYYYDVRSIL